MGSFYRNFCLKSTRLHVLKGLKEFGKRRDLLFIACLADPDIGILKLEKKNLSTTPRGKALSN